MRNKISWLDWILTVSQIHIMYSKWPAKFTCFYYIHIFEGPTVGSLCESMRNRGIPHRITLSGAAILTISHVSITLAIWRQLSSFNDLNSFHNYVLDQVESHRFLSSHGHNFEILERKQDCILRLSQIPKFIGRYQPHWYIFSI